MELQNIEKQYNWPKLDKLNLTNAAPRNFKVAVDIFTAQLGSHVVRLGLQRVILSTAGIILAKYTDLI